MHDANNHHSSHPYRTITPADEIMSSIVRAKDKIPEDDICFDNKSAFFRNNTTRQQSSP
jgi:hypothetical protein